MTCAGCEAELPPNKGPGRARKWCSEKCRKATYTVFDPCVDCGAPTSSGARNGHDPEPRCLSCASRERTLWTRELIIERIQAWATLYGEPPAIPDWNPIKAREFGDLHRIARFWEGDWPWFTIVYHRFGSWNAALVAAGFEPRVANGGHGNCQRRQSVRLWPADRIIDAIRAWHDEHGCLPTALEWPSSSESHPGATQVAVRFGSWAAGMEAAGFTPRRKGEKRVAA